MRRVYLGGGVVVLVSAVIAAILATSGTPTTANVWVDPSDDTGCARVSSRAEYDASKSCSIDGAAGVAQAGDLILVRTGSYDAFDGTDKAITIKSAPGNHVQTSMFLRTGDCCFTLDGGPELGIEITANGGPTIGSGVTNLLLKNLEFTTAISIDNPGPNANIVFDHNWHHNVGVNGNPPGALTFAYDTPSSCGCTVKNSLMENFSADGIQTGTGLLVENNIFKNILPSNEEEHTDNVQSVGSVGTTVRGNLVTGNCEQGITSFDGGANLAFEHNVIAGCTAHWLSMGAHDVANPLATASMQYNTIDTALVDGAINCEAVTNMTLRNNIAGNMFLANCAPVTRTNNMTLGGGFGDTAGVPIFVGGSGRKKFRDYCLSPTSPGYTGASDGGQVGACGGGFGGGPPDDWYTFPGTGL